MESTQLGTKPTAAGNELLLALERLDHQVRTLQAALLTNRRIGVAIGIVMREQRISDTAAFLALRRLSMDTNSKLRDVAEHVIETGQLATEPRPGPVDAGVPPMTPDDPQARSPKP